MSALFPSALLRGKIALVLPDLVAAGRAFDAHSDLARLYPEYLFMLHCMVRATVLTSTDGDSWQVVTDCGATNELFAVAGLDDGTRSVVGVDEVRSKESSLWSVETDPAKAAPAPKSVFGSDVAPKADGSIYRMVRYPKAGYWVSYSRTAGADPMVTVTMQKM